MNRKTKHKVKSKDVIIMYNRSLKFNQGSANCTSRKGVGLPKRVFCCLLMFLLHSNLSNSSGVCVHVVVVLHFSVFLYKHVSAPFCPSRSLITLSLSPPHTLASQSGHPVAGARSRPRTRAEPGTRMSVLLANPDYLLEGFAEKRCKVCVRSCVCACVCM